MTDRARLQTLETTGSAGDILVRQSTAPGVAWTHVGVTQSAYKASDQNVNNSTTLVDDNALSVNVEAGARYTITAIIFANLAVNSGIKFALNGTSTITALKAEIRIIDSGGTREEGRVAAYGSAVAHGAAGTGDHFIEILGAVEINAAGTLLVQWAQSAAVVGNATVQIASTLRATRIA